MTYDDERVVALLKESVPPVPEVPSRVESVRRIASRQRYAASASMLGVVASVLLVVVAAALVLRPSGERAVQPVGDPLRSMVAAFRARETVRVEITFASGANAGRVLKRGAYRLDGRALVDEFLDLRGIVVQERRVVDGVEYRTPTVGEELPSRKRWVRVSERSTLRPQEVLTVEGIAASARDVRYTGTGRVRGRPVSEYTMRLSAQGAPEVEGTTLTLALDADGLPRRITFDYGGSAGHPGTTIEYFGYDEPVEVEAPPASEVADEDDVRHVPDGPDPKALLWACGEAPRVSEAMLNACIDSYTDRVDGVSCDLTYVSSKAWSYRCSDGTTGRAKP